MTAVPELIELSAINLSCGSLRALRARPPLHALLRPVAQEINQHRYAMASCKISCSLHSVATAIPEYGNVRRTSNSLVCRTCPMLWP
jgi:hypothetical protein